LPPPRVDVTTKKLAAVDRKIWEYWSEGRRKNWKTFTAKVLISVDFVLLEIQWNEWMIEWKNKNIFCWPKIARLNIFGLSLRIVRHLKFDIFFQLKIQSLLTVSVEISAVPIISMARLWTFFIWCPLTDWRSELLASWYFIIRPNFSW
jgi:hypothetical protein